MGAILGSQELSDMGTKEAGNGLHFFFLTTVILINYLGVEKVMLWKGIKWWEHIKKVTFLGILPTDTETLFMWYTDVGSFLQLWGRNVLCTQARSSSDFWLIFFALYSINPSSCLSNQHLGICRESFTFFNVVFFLLMTIYTSINDHL